jgi:hypothetical protein
MAYTKVELLSIHSLLYQITEQYDEWGNPIDLTEYRELDTSHTKIHGSISDHETAIKHLAKELKSEAESSQSVQNNSVKQIA